MHVGRRHVARLATTALGLLAVLALPASPAGGSAPARGPDDLAAAHEAVVQSAGRLADAQRALDDVTARAAELGATMSDLTEQLAEARAELRARAVGAYVAPESVDTFMVMLGGEDLFDATVASRMAAHSAVMSHRSVQHYDRLRTDADPALVALATELQQRTQDVADATDALAAARANEAEAERQLAARRAADDRRRADEAAAAAAASARARNAAATAVANSVTTADAPAGGPTEAQWAALRDCESSGNYQAISPTGTYRGAYQFDRTTWAALGGAGDPASAPPAEQDARAKLLYSRRGWRPWPVCGRYLQ